MLLLLLFLVGTAVAVAFALSLCFCVKRIERHFKMTFARRHTVGWKGEVDNELDCNIDNVAISTILLSIVFNKV